jgi:ribonuclease HI
MATDLVPGTTTVMETVAATDASSETERAGVRVVDIDMDSLAALDSATATIAVEEKRTALTEEEKGWVSNPKA